METIDLLISDETLRDGEQQVGLFLPDKARLARLIAQTGVHQIAIMPAVHPTETQLAKNLVTGGLKHQVIASTIMTQAAIDASMACGVDQIILFHAVSDRLLVLRDPVFSADPKWQCKTLDDELPSLMIKQAQQRMLARALEHVRYAHGRGLRICFAAEDASRADLAFLLDCIEGLSPYLEQFLLCDTVGILTPEKTFDWIQVLLAQCPDAFQAMRLSVHFHNDMGLALENTIQAVRAGATGISGTFGGIGERAGNVALEQVLQGLKIRFGLQVDGIDYDALDRVMDYLHQQDIRPHPPYSSQSQRHESGIHVSSLLRDRQSYSAFPHGQAEIWFGKCSGTSNLRYLFEQHLQQPLSQADYVRLRNAIKTIAIEEQRSFSVEDVLELIERRGLLRPACPNPVRPRSKVAECRGLTRGKAIANVPADR